MICPRCGKEIEDSETLCPFCMQEINKNVEFNDFRKDGFVQIQTKEGAKHIEPESISPKYFKLAEFNIFVIAVVYILLVSVFTVFSLRFLQKTTFTYVEPYKIKPITDDTPDEQETTEASLPVVKDYSIKNIYGSWCFEKDKDNTASPIVYYTFESSGLLQENFGSIEVKGSFSDVSDSDSKKIYLNVDSDFRGVFNYVVAGDEKNGYVLELYQEDKNVQYKLVQAEAKIWNVKPPENPKIDKKLVGKWYTEDKKKAYIFTETGSFKRITGNTSTKGAWSVDSKNTLTVKYMRDVLSERDIPYATGNDENRIIVNGVEYIRS